MKISHTSDDYPDDERDSANLSQCRRESRFRRGNLLSPALQFLFEAASWLVKREESPDWLLRIQSGDNFGNHIPLFRKSLWKAGYHFLASHKPQNRQILTRHLFGPSTHNIWNRHRSIHQRHDSSKEFVGVYCLHLKPYLGKNTDG